MKHFKAYSTAFAIFLAAAAGAHAQTGGMKGMDMKGMDMKDMPVKDMKDMKDRGCSEFCVFDFVRHC